ncbi:hypothetical protein AC26_2554 [Escherichia coli 1-176-05_S3_C2]|nr:hypothetical protein AC26_4362 [Escherichia coli 1-176-05_S3_C2]EYD83423.1 hypothetical protein AC26_2554 [Escherichia coli 1-176-05_S3_C2]
MSTATVDGEHVSVTSTARLALAVQTPEESENRYHFYCKTVANIT